MSEFKGKGGFSIIDLVCFNKALLAKQLLRLINPNLLVSKVLKSKYLRGDQSWNREPPKATSWVWKSLMGGKQLLDKGM